MDNDKLLTAEHDKASDLLIVDGVRYSGHMFRTMALCEPGTWLRVECRRDGVITVFAPGPDMDRAFDTITGKGAICGA